MGKRNPKEEAPQTSEEEGREEVTEFIKSLQSRKLTFGATAFVILANANRWWESVVVFTVWSICHILDKTPEE